VLLTRDFKVAPPSLAWVFPEDPGVSLALALVHTHHVFFLLSSYHCTTVLAVLWCTCMIDYSSEDESLVSLGTGAVSRFCSPTVQHT
jgi:hypothetical protein